ncbi:MAG: DUF4065 domain-containing protein [Alphaproteobacteria bacterium]|nr:DUF4065 domain-containing protein [Alphaproteobacteria bacterium]
MTNVSSSEAPTKAAAVANEFLKLGDAENIAIDPMKLQKLVYYAHAWYLAHNDNPLFDDDVEAWPWGPVIRSIYDHFQGFGRDPIKGKKATILRKTGNEEVNFSFEAPELDNQDLKDFIKLVWDSHKDFTGIQLSNATHMPNEPWTIVKDQYGDLDKKPPIDNEIIKFVFKSKLVTAQ